MDNYKDLKHIFTGSEITVGHLKLELEDSGIPCHVQNDYDDGISAVRGSMGSPFAVDVYVRLEDEKKALDIVDKLNMNLEDLTDK